METVEDKIAQHGKSLITNLFILVRITKIYDSMNEAILKTAGRLLSDVEAILEETGEISIKIIAGSFYIEGTRIKAGVSDIENFTSLAGELKKRGIGALDLISPLSAEDLIRLAYAVKSEGDASEVQAELERSHTRNILIGGPVCLQEEDIDLKDSRAVARRAYLKAVAAMHEMDNAVKSGTRMKLKRIKRALQLVVDCILTDESNILLFTRVRNADTYYYCHPVNVSVLSSALGKRIGLDRVHLRNLALAALCHDAGKIEVPRSIITKKGEFTPNEMELIKRHPVDGIKVLLRSFGLSETSILSMLVSFEHHLKPDLSGYPDTSAERRPNLFSRIVTIADDYDSMVSGLVYERKRRAPAEALSLMNSRKGQLYDPALLKAFFAIFG